ncbi:phosphoribosyltransferase-like protein [Faecalibacterium gallinarum]|uniref:PRTase-CE domain-containing protein n=1 Tax=Faecalibacterium gallinarum TaxID=2903556 RepID=A0AA37IZ07_9FIRM|nr:hypothetical protein [Faecalibacterium gallinarum]GJN64609.1 hypothetical protein JCM17207_12340 [Faecalibacterium gallinarum]
MQNRSIKKKASNTLKEKSATVEDVARVQRLFEEKGWPLESGEFDDFCTMIANLANEAQKELILQLSKRFCWITANDYYQMFVTAFDQMVKAKIGATVRKLTFTILPLLPSDNVNDVKSGHFLYYLVKAHLPKLQKQYKEKCVISCLEGVTAIIENNTTMQLKKMYSDPDIFICPIDDYIGSGNTVLDCLHNLESWGIPKEKITFLALVSQEQGLKKCADEAVSVFSTMQMKRQITDYPNSEKNTQVMTEIEESINIKDEFRFGYEKSEALVKLEHTPNNTFPVYWFTNKNRRTVPFPR